MSLWARAKTLVEKDPNAGQLDGQQASTAVESNAAAAQAEPAIQEEVK